MHWLKLKVPGWQTKAIINGVGATATFLVLIDIIAEKFLEGAWVIVLLIVLLVGMFRTIYRHYADVAQQLKMAHYHAPSMPMTNTALVLIPSLHLGIMPALSMRAPCRRIVAPSISRRTRRKPRLERALGALGGDVPLVILHSPFGL